MTSDGYLGPVQQRGGALIELLAACPAAEPAVTLGGALGPLRHGFRSTFQAPHPRPPLHERWPYTRPSPRPPRPVARALTEPLKRQGMVADEWVTDKNPAYGAALRSLKLTRAPQPERQPQATRTALGPRTHGPAPLLGPL